jgi:DNA repair protein RecO (recombination protein O)
LSQRQKVEQQPGFILHSYPYRETSLIVELFSRDHGRVPLVAKGARRPLSALRGVLMAFQPLLVDWSGAGEVKTLLRAEWQGGQPLLAGRALLCAYYLNELLVKLLAREDAHPCLFACYAAALAELPAASSLAALLRRFELDLLGELGYGLSLERDVDSGEPLRGEADYAYIIERGAVAAGTADAAQPLVRGQVLLDLARGDFSDPLTRQQGKLLLRRLINHYLGGQELQSRRVLMELQDL